MISVISYTFSFERMRFRDITDIAAKDERLLGLALGFWVVVVSSVSVALLQLVCQMKRNTDFRMTHLIQWSYQYHYELCCC